MSKSNSSNLAFWNWKNLLVSGFGLGHLPWAPGTFGSLLGIPLGIYILHLSLPLALLVLAVLFLASIPLVQSCSKALNDKDPRRIVIDEVIGQAISFLGIMGLVADLSPKHWILLSLNAFLLFRVFDVLKPFPVKNFEALPGAWGIMADDVIAGILSALCLRGIYLLL